MKVSDLKFREVYFKTKVIGYEIQIDKTIVFFGNINGTKENLIEYYHQFNFKSIKQTHSDSIVCATDELIEADAHYSEVDGEGLIIATADCAPVLISDLKEQRIAAIHAGWRGVVNQISIKSITKMIELGSRPENIMAFIGPHIQFQSFEVEMKIAEKLLRSVPEGFSEKFIYTSPQIKDGNSVESNLKCSSESKIMVDLNAILQAQILSLDVQFENLNILKMDTKSDKQWNSYRRDKEKSGRNLSFVGRLQS